MKKVFRFIAAAALVCLCAACKKDPIEVQSVSLDRTTLTIVEGSSEQFTATVKPDNVTNRNVNWSSSDNTVATVSAGGKVTAVKEGTATIIVTTEDGGKTATCKVTVISDIPVPAEGVQLWADGPYWATTNIGAANAWDYGLYFEWGNIIGYAPSGDSFSHSFDKTNYAKTPGSKLAGDFKTASYDAAQTSWGGKWRMPTKAEFDALLSNCDKKWYDGVEDQYYGKPVAGYKFTGKGDYSGNSIFLPAAGRGNGSTLGTAGSTGYYWSSSYGSNSFAYYLYFGSGLAYTDDYFPRYRGFPVRPVSD